MTSLAIVLSVICVFVTYVAELGERIEPALRSRRHPGPEPYLVEDPNVTLVGDGGPIQARGRMFNYLD
jgi:hypothetical protein